MAFKVAFQIGNQEPIIRKVVAIPRIGETVFIYELNGPLKVQDVQYGVRRGRFMDHQWIAVILG